MSEQVGSSPLSGGGAPVAVYGSDAVVTMPPDTTLSAIAEELANDDISLVVIGTVTDVVGVVSERDVVRAVAGKVDLTTTTAADVASSKLVWCDHTATVREAAELMMEQYVRHVLIEDDGRLAGVVSARDLLGAYAMSPT